MVASSQHDQHTEQSQLDEENHPKARVHKVRRRADLGHGPRETGDQDDGQTHRSDGREAAGGDGPIGPSQSSQPEQQPGQSTDPGTDGDDVQPLQSKVEGPIHRDAVGVASPNDRQHGQRGRAGQHGQRNAPRQRAYRIDGQTAGDQHGRALSEKHHPLVRLEERQK